jgi:hypothetical protein
MAMKLLRTIGRGLRWLGRGLVSLVRDDAYTDIRATYPEHAKATQEQAATNASVTTSLSGLGHSGVA